MSLSISWLIVTLPIRFCSATQEGNTALHAACDKGHWKVCKFLLSLLKSKKRLELNFKQLNNVCVHTTFFRQPAVILVVPFLQKGETPLHIACRVKEAVDSQWNQSAEEIRKLLIDNYNDVDLDAVDQVCKYVYMCLCVSGNIRADLNVPSHLGSGFSAAYCLPIRS